MKHISFYCCILLLCFVSMVGVAQEKDRNMTCGSITEPNAYQNDMFYGDNQKLVDLLIEEGIDIPKDYLNKLEEPDRMTTSNNVIFKIGGKQRDIPIKAWVYRNNITKKIIIKN